MSEDKVYNLLRGGYLVRTPAGSVQFGSPPETIKDTMKLPGGVPQVYVLPDEFFSWNKGISVAELEFPLYYNFFLKKRKTYIICDEDQFVIFKKVLKESLFGPKDLDLGFDYVLKNRLYPVPDLKKEMNYFRGSLKLSDLVRFGIFKNDSFTIGKITIKKTEQQFELEYKKKSIARVPGVINYSPHVDIGKRLVEPFEPPLFGVTCLGPSHGFDPENNTSGFIIWLNHSGIMVDPPVNSTEWLLSSNVNPKLIDSIILTHCHADHDAGTFQKIIEETRIQVYTTPTVMNSFLTKYSAFTRVSRQYMMKLFSFSPVRIGQPVFIHGGKFNFFYTLHSIPTIGFRLSFQNQSMVYSSDHNNDPALHQQLYEKGILSKARYHELSRFPWDSKVIYHESGIAPLHTPLEVLKELPEQLQQRTIIYHIAEKDFDKGKGLTLAKPGIENTVYFETEPPVFETAAQILDLLKHLDFSSGMPITKAREFLYIVEEERFKKGDTIIKKGSIGDRFYIIYSGNVSVKSGGLKTRKIYGAYDYFGEAALVTETERTADVIAETDVVAYTIEKEKFLSFIADTEFEKILLRLAKIRDHETWNVLSKSRYFQVLTSTQKTWLESMFENTTAAKGSTIISEGNPIKKFYIIREGTAAVYKNGNKTATLERGDFIGTPLKIQKQENAEFTIKAETEMKLYRISQENIQSFMQANPGLQMKLVYEFSKDYDQGIKQ